ncbi:ABC transporter, ATP-binding protein [Bacteriovorax sp. BAL6_X]|uniref:ABC transporter ATP-binding protein n=1 Tax=Bacteriovorax sp. BAL6_X TaxID=1201290 RepID=UPI00038690DE|nr:ABC transporter ATP-binding protein [Bacteriovorax sp. BAL6_X]EPZ49349.1 ABC transporter, ATP-binding protein [Bacteriovorax sp. BAL6_X]
MSDNNLVELSDIRKTFPGKDVLKGVNLTIGRKGVLGFLGPNGAGKSTLMKIILEEQEYTTGGLTKDSELTIGYLPEEPALYRHMCVRPFLEFVQEIYQIADNTYAIEEVIEKCGLKEVAHQRIENLSKGYKQKVGIAAAICHNPKLLVLDEPLVGLDPHAIIQIKDVIKELSKDHTIFISSHQLSDLASICDDIAILHEGVIVAHGPIKDIEKKLEVSQRVEVEFESVDEDKLQGLKEMGINFSNKDGIYEFSGQTQDSDLRITLSKYFAQNDLAILSQQNIKVGLEDIFKKLTAKKEEIRE